VELFGRGLAWLDTGTCQGLLQTANFVNAVQTRQRFYIACLEEIAYLEIAKNVKPSAGLAVGVVDAGDLHLARIMPFINGPFLSMKSCRRAGARTAFVVVLAFEGLVHLQHHLEVPYHVRLLADHKLCEHGQSILLHGGPILNFFRSTRWSLP